MTNRYFLDVEIFQRELMLFEVFCPASTPLKW